ncbi:MAG: ATP-binding cassette domain-containing protein [Candidatus Sumerlaeia bacterium]|nr:ATP-binding cassette domain-containing protein [Candidatus Sumerlaeia bacterium]
MSTNGAAPIISVRGFEAAYRGDVVLRDVDFEVRRGEVFVILGGSGCGKSTLLKHMIGLFEPAAGVILIEGRDIAKSHGAERRAILARIGVMYQLGALFGSLNLLENVRLPLEEFTTLPPDAMNRIARMKLEIVGLADYTGHMPAQISGGMQKRAAIARAMALDPPILFLDEPSAGLDPITSAGLDDLIRQLSRTLGITFVVVTHELASIFAIADRVIMLEKTEKTIIATGTPAELRDHGTHPFVRKFFHRESEGD